VVRVSRDPHWTCRYLASNTSWGGAAVC